jgi:tetratricopeptide (TPR) repeat protein
VPTLAIFIVAGLVTYAPLLLSTGGFLWDDAGHLTSPARQSFDGLRRIWFEIGATQQYYPVVHSAFWLQAALWGTDSPIPYHVVSVLLHAGSAVLLFRILQLLEIPGAWLGGLLFLVHPVHVESVAWTAELKNTLSGVCYFAAALHYLQFDRARTRGRYAAALVLFLLAVLSKSVTATLPVALAVLVLWRRGRLVPARDLLPLAPFVLLGAAAGALTVWFERTLIGAEGQDFALTFVERGLIAGRAIVFYLTSLVWPVGLTFNYPRWNVSQDVWWQYLYPAAVITALFVCWRSRMRGVLTALLLFVITAGPALGFVNVYPFRFSYVADHFQYLASASVLALIAAGLWTWLGPRLRTIPAVIAGSLIVASPLAVQTARLSRDYVDAPTLYRATIANNPDSWLAHNNLSALLLTSQPPDFASAARHAREALRVFPEYAEARFNLAVALHELGDLPNAAAEYRRLLAQPGATSHLRHREATIQRRLGQALTMLGRAGEAIEPLEAAVAIEPDSAASRASLGMALAQTGDLARARPHFEAAARLAPAEPEHQINLGAALLQGGDYAGAARALEEAARRAPAAPDVHHNLGSAYLALGRYADAVRAFEDALRLRPNDTQTQAALATARARLRR